MQSPPATVGVGRVLKNSRRCLGRLKAHPKVCILAPKLQVAHDALKKANLALNDADDAAQDSGAAIDMCDSLAREALTDFQLGLVALVRRDYKCPEYLAFFADGFDATKRRSGMELRTALLAIGAHIATLAKDSPLQAHSKPLQACVAAYTPALAGDEKAQAALAQAQTQLGVARAQWLLAYDALAGDVRSMLPGRKALVQSFFPEWTKKKDKVAPK
jgi:hypothetical protein